MSTHWICDRTDERFDDQYIEHEEEMNNNMPTCPYCNGEVQFIQFYPETFKFLITSVFVTCLMECPKCKIQFKQEYWYQRKESICKKIS